MTLLRRGRRLRALGIDDGPFIRRHHRDVLVVGAIYNATQFDGLLTTHVRQDGYNATKRLIQMIAGSKFHAQLHIVMLDGITLGGFNVIDLAQLAHAVGIPCVAVMRRKPDQEAVNRALSRLAGGARRRKIMDRAGPVHLAGSLYFQAAGIEPHIARQAILDNTIHGLIPECLRAAHLIAKGIVTGQSGRRA